MEKPRDTYSFNEAQARYILIDPALRQAGWNLDDRAQVGFEELLWVMCDALRSNMDASDSKHVKFGVSLT